MYDYIYKYIIYSKYVRKAKMKGKPKWNTAFQINLKI